MAPRRLIRLENRPSLSDECAWDAHSSYAWDNFVTETRVGVRCITLVDKLREKDPVVRLARPSSGESKSPDGWSLSSSYERVSRVVKPRVPRRHHWQSSCVVGYFAAVTVGRRNTRAVSRIVYDRNRAMIRTSQVARSLSLSLSLSLEDSQSCCEMIARGKEKERGSRVTNIFRLLQDRYPISQ